MTRDSKAWWFFIGGSVLAALTTHFDLLHRAVPILPVWVDPMLELISMLTGVVSGVLRMSPLPISPEGRVEQASKRVDALGAAQEVVTGAAIKMNRAADATDRAAVAASDAKKAVDKVG